MVIMSVVSIWLSH